MNNQWNDIWNGLKAAIFVALVFIGIEMARNRQGLPLIGIGWALIAWFLALVIFLHLYRVWKRNMDDSR